MLRFVSLGVLALLLCSCAHNNDDSSAWIKEFEEFRLMFEARQKVWEENFARLPGTPVSNLVSLWGEPEKVGDGEYRWYKHEEYEYGGGYYVDGGYTTSDVYATTDTGMSRIVGHIRTPNEPRYVPPTIFAKKCEILVAADKDGIITHTRASYNINNTVTRCPEMFFFPKEE